ncbi:uncharacterized protein VTP21DRAFT_2166 [Calcarisporiella thermophila]|uniref:uncharacterized protein n=1 Tax=Calcarisporiella thermophila TaxID=911321 RepID=UPI0037429FC8
MSNAVKEEKENRQAAEQKTPSSQKPMQNESRDPAYFGYYSMLQHQQNMLQDSVRTSTYRSAILLKSASCFNNKIVMDVGAGSGILSYFAVQAGAEKVYAVEASKMASNLKKLVKQASTTGKNAFLKDRIEVVNAKIEDPDLPIPKVDTIISEPIGVLLVHERMLESYVYARDHYLKPGGALFPSKGTIHLAPFTDAILWTETMGKARFWESTSFYGVDLSPLFPDAKDELFRQPVVGQFDHRTLLSYPSPTGHVIDFYTITFEQLHDIVIPFTWLANYTGIIHGIAGWFDAFFEPPRGEAGETIVLTTAPSAERTHWSQVRFLFREPIAVNAGQLIRGWMRLTVNEMRSYNVYAELVVGSNVELGDPMQLPKELLSDEGTTSSEGEILDESNVMRRYGRWHLHEQTYNYNFTYPPTTDFKPEYSCMYEPAQPVIPPIPAAFAESEMGVEAPLTMMDFDSGFANSNQGF